MERKCENVLRVKRKVSIRFETGAKEESVIQVRCCCRQGV